MRTQRTGRRAICGIAVVLFLGAIAATGAEDVILVSEDFNSYAPGAGLIKDIGWASGPEKDDVYLSRGGRRGAQDLFLNGSTNIPVERGGSTVTFFSKKLDSQPDTFGGRYVILEADLRGGHGPGPEALTGNSNIWLQGRPGGHPGTVGKWVRSYDGGESAWTLMISKDIALAAEPSETLRSMEKAGQWVRAAIVVDSEARTVQGMLLSAGGKAYHYNAKVSELWS